MLAWLFQHVPRLRLIPGLPQIVDTFLMLWTAVFHQERLLPMREIEHAVLSWPGVTVKPHRFGGTEFVFNKREIGHLHGHGLLDIPFTKSIRDEVISVGQAQPHHIFPHSAWISFYIRSKDDIPKAIALLRRNYQRWETLDGDKAKAANVL